MAADFRDSTLSDLIVAVAEIFLSVLECRKVYKIYELVNVIPASSMFSDDKLIALYQKLFVLHNSLQRLQGRRSDRGYINLDVGLVDVKLNYLSVPDTSRQHLPQEQMFFFDAHLFENITADQVQKLIDQFWLNSASSSEQKHAYDFFGINDDASWSSIKKRYRELSNRYHPDKGGDPEQFMKMQEAYNCLRKTKMKGKK